MNSIIIYFSYHRGNTSKIAHVIGRELHSDIARSKDFNVKNLKNYDLIGLGSGIYNGKPHRSVLELVDKLDESCVKINTFLYSARVEKIRTVILMNSNSNLKVKVSNI
ncbi:MAG: flavodoxin domain-containing protein [candidate division WOR-3 bacterium]